MRPGWRRGRGGETVGRMNTQVIQDEQEQQAAPAPPRSGSTVAIVFGAIAVWAVIESKEHSVTSWVTLGVVAALLAVSTLIKYLWPVRRRRARTLL